MGRMPLSPDPLTAARERAAALRRQPVEARADAVRDLEAADNPGADLLLLLMTEDRSPDVRGTALETLDRRRSPLTRIAARACITDSGTWVRVHAADALRYVGTRADVPR